MIDEATRTCPDCEREFVPRSGRGPKSSLCPDCQRGRRRRSAQLRGLRHSLATLAEWVDVLGPEAIKRKEAIAESQGGQCADCGKARKLYLAEDPDGRIVGVCLTCHSQRRK